MAFGFAYFTKLISFFGVLWSCKAYFDIDELNSINYGIELIPKPVLLGQAGSGAHHILLSTKHGQQYQCTFQDKNIQAEKENKEEQTAKETGIPELLKPMEDGPCLLANKGWWTYEFCYGKQISQYHMDDGKILGKTMVLGVYHSEYDWEKEEDEQAKKERLRRYHSQQYSNGSVCDLTNSPRRSEVRFVCDDSTGDYISTIDEPESCVYVITVHTPRICHHPYLKPTRTSKSVPITCNPVLEQGDYDLYLKQEADEKKRREEQRKKASDMKKAAETKAKLKRKLGDLFGEDVEAGSATDRRDKVVNKFKDTMINVIKKRAETPSRRAARQAQRDRYSVAGQPESPESRPAPGTAPSTAPSTTPLDEDAELFREFDQGLKEIADDPEKRKMIPSLKDHLKETMTKEFGNIMKEAEEELRSEGQETKVDERVALKSLADTLSTLLSKLDKSTKEMEKLEKGIKELGEDARTSREKLMNKLMKDDTKSEQKTADTKPESEEKPSEPPLEPDDDPTDPNQEKVTVRVTKKADDDTILKFEDAEDEASLGTEQQKQLEAQVKSELRRAGLDTKGQKIRVKIISGLSKDGEKLTEEDSATFKRMVVAILGRNAEEDAAAEREDSLVNAYNYRWRPQSPTPTLDDPDDPDNDEL